MISPHDFLYALAVVLCVAAVTTVISQKLHLPVVLGYLVAGLIIGPHLPVPLVADRALVIALSELGVILVMFSLGLEFSLKQLKKVGPTAGITAIIECGLMLIAGFLMGRALGWTTTESIFAGAIVAISSTTIIVKTFDEQSIGGKLRELVVGVLIVEDLIAIVLLATLTAISSGAGLSAMALATTLGKLAAFLVVLLVAGLLVVPRAARAVTRLNRPETTLVASVGFCFSVALLAQHFGYSVALGAFIAGSLIAESGEGKVVEHLVQPVRDLFAAVFFVSVGMQIDPVEVAAHWGAALLLVTVVIVGKVLTVTVGSFLTGNGSRTSVQAGMSLAQIGEFSFIIAGLGMTLGTTGSFLFPVAAAASVVTALSTGWLVKASGPVASFIDRKLPRRVQTFTTLYGSWLEQLREAPPTPQGAARRLVRSLLIDAALLTVVIVIAAVSRRYELTFGAPLWTVLVIAAIPALPLCVGIVRLSQRLASELSEAALPTRKDGKVDLAAAPRRVLIVTLQAAIVLAVGGPMVAITQPLIPEVPVGVVLLGLLAVLAITFWRTTSNLEGHVRAGAEVIAEALMAQSREGEEPRPGHAMDDLSKLLPGLGLSAPSEIELDEGSPALGKTLAALNLRGVTGATVLAITRGSKAIVATATEVLQEGDRLALAGSRQAIDAARGLLAAPPPPVPLESAPPAA